MSVSETNPMPKSSNNGRFDRAAWLRAALNVLASDGQARLNVEKLAGKLGVTKGSFYYHFRNRQDFIEKLLAFWEEEFTQQQLRALAASKAPAHERLFRLAVRVEREQLNKFDTAFRCWAAQDTLVAKVVRRVDAARFTAIKAIFAEIGFTGVDLIERTRIFVLFHSSLSIVQVPDESPVTDDLIRERVRFFTQSRGD